MSRKSENTRRAPLPLDLVRDQFAALSATYSIDGHQVDGLPDQTLTLAQARDRILDRGCPIVARDELWRLLITRARNHGADWTMACAGVALPALAASTHRLGSWYGGEHADLQAEILTGFLHALATVVLARPGVAERLRWAAYRAGHAAVVASLSDPRPFELDEPLEVVEAILTGFRSAIPQPPWGHPDLVLARAIADGVLTPTEADLIGATRLDAVRLDRWARRRNVPYATANTTRWRAERRLVAYLAETSRDADPDDAVNAATETSCAIERPARHPDRPARQSRAVSGRRRNGREPGGKDRSPSVKDEAPESGLFRCRDFASRSRPSSPGSEDRRCA